MRESSLKIPAMDGIEYSREDVFIVILQGYPIILCIPIRIIAEQSTEHENKKLQ